MVDTELSRRERQIMDILYEKEQASAAEVHESLEDPPTYTTVRTLLRILEEKAYATHSRDGKKFIYSPTRSIQGAGKNAMQRVLNVFYGGSVEKALAAHLTDPDAKIAPDEIASLRKLIDEAESNEQSQSTKQAGKRNVKKSRAKKGKR